MNKQTAVDFLKEKLTYIFINDEGFHKLFEQAKAMEKEQIEQAFVDGVDSGSLMDANTYYQKTYGGNK